MSTNGSPTSLKWWFHLAVLFLGCFLALPYFTKESNFGLLDYAILPFHEAGHYVLMPFAPEFWVVAGGSIVQIGLPFAFALYFWWRVRDEEGTLHCRDSFAAGVAVFWMASSVQGMAVYMKDARFLLLPLLGADPTEGHDWNFLFGKMHLLNRSLEIGNFFHALGRLEMLAALLYLTAHLVVSYRAKTLPA